MGYALRNGRYRYVAWYKNRNSIKEQDIIIKELYDYKNDPEETVNIVGIERVLAQEAIAIGMICESFLSVHNKKLSKNEFDKISEYIINVYQPIKINFIEEILININQDKKNINQKIMISSLNKIGKCEYDIEVNHEEIIKSINYYNNIIS